MEKKKLTVNIYRFGKYALGGLLVAAYPLYVLFQSLSGDDTLLANAGDDSTLVLVGIGVLGLTAVLTAIYGLLSLFVSKAMFHEDHLEYKTLFKKYNIKYEDIVRVQETRRTKRGLFGSTQHLYTVLCKGKSKSYTLDSYEFVGIGKQLDKLKEEKK